MRFGRLLQIQTIDGAPIQVGDMVLVPQARALMLHLPRGGFVWNHPVAVVVQRGTHRQRIPIVDMTRMIQLAAFAFMLIAWGVLARAVRRSDGRVREGSTTNE